MPAEAGIQHKIRRRSSGGERDLFFVWILDTGFRRYDDADDHFCS